MFENIDAAGWMTIGGCLLLGFCVVYFIMDKPRKDPSEGIGTAAGTSAKGGEAAGGSARSSDGADDESGQRARSQEHRDEFREPRSTPQHWSEVLDVPSVAHLDEIKAAYRRKMSQYHPDKVATLGPELKQLADLMTKRINHAYDQAMRERSSG